MSIIPFEPVILGIKINTHLILEYAAFFISFRYYLFLRKQISDKISSANRLSIILAAAVGAFVGSRLMAYLEHPIINLTVQDLMLLMQAKTIMGGLFGGLIAVELAKQILGEKESSGDLFTFPILVGIFIGRIGCLLAGTNEFTYGEQTTFFAGMDLGDGLMRHPIALYEMIFIVMLFIVLQKLNGKDLKKGLLFKYFMLAYFGFRFFIEFIKPNTFFLFKLSSIQWLCIACFIYYFKTLFVIFRYAYQKIHLLRFYH